MAIKLSQGFQITSKQPIDTRVTLTKVEMAAMNDSLMPDVYFAICKDDSKLYAYTKTNEADPVTGKFRVASGDIAADDDVEDMLNEVFGE